MDMPWLAERDAVTQSAEVLALGKNALHQSSAAVGPCQTWGGIPSRICMGSAHVAAIAVESPLLNASTYCSTAAIGSSKVGMNWVPRLLSRVTP